MHYQTLWIQWNNVLERITCKKVGYFLKWKSSELKYILLHSLSLVISFLHLLILKNIAKCNGFGGKIFQRDSGQKACYTLDRFSSSTYDYEAAKSFCEDKDGMLPEIKGPKDQSNLESVITNTVIRLPIGNWVLFPFAIFSHSVCSIKEIILILCGRKYLLVFNVN